MCTTGETYDANCGCSGGTFQDSDADGVCDSLDSCPNDPNNTCNLTTPCVSFATNTTYEHIESITIGSFTNTSGSNSGYGDYSAMSIEVIPGETLNLELVPFFSGQSYTEHWAIWVDVDNNGSFDFTEQLFAGSNTATTFGTLTVPTLAPGSYNMRISMQYNDAPPPCSTYTYGEVEDLSLIHI